MPLLVNMIRPWTARQGLDFAPTSDEELLTLLGGTIGKSSMLDSLPGCILKDCLVILLPVVTTIFNLSFEEAVVPQQFKVVVLNPKIKKPLLDHELLSSFRPISNLRFIAKATEKVAASRLECHLSDSDLHVLLQSAYKQNTKTALVKVHNDVLRSIDNGERVILLLLDLFAAFDTVDMPYYLVDSRISLTSRGKPFPLSSRT